MNTKQNKTYIGMIISSFSYIIIDIPSKVFNFVMSFFFSTKKYSGKAHEPTKRAEAEAAKRAEAEAAKRAEAEAAAHFVLDDVVNTAVKTVERAEAEAAERAEIEAAELADRLATIDIDVDVSTPLSSPTSVRRQLSFQSPQRLESSASALTTRSAPNTPLRDFANMVQEYLPESVHKTLTSVVKNDGLGSPPDSPVRRSSTLSSPSTQSSPVRLRDTDSPNNKSVILAVNPILPIDESLEASRFEL